MAELKNIVSQLKNAAKVLLGQVADIDAQITELNARRDALTGGVVSKEDFLNYARAHFQRKGAVFERGILNAIEGRPRDYASLERSLDRGDSFLALQFLTASNVPVEITENAIFFYFEDILIERLGKALDKLQWPEDAIPAALRHEMLLDIEQDTDTLQRQRADLVASLDEAGITGI